MASTQVFCITRGSALRHPGGSEHQLQAGPGDMLGLLQFMTKVPDVAPVSISSAAVCHALLLLPPESRLAAAPLSVGTSLLGGAITKT